VPDRELHLRAISLGAMGVVLKVDSSSCLFKAIRRVHSGEVWLNRSMMAAAMADSLRSRTAMKADPEQAKIASLTSRELQIIRLIGEGLKNKQIGERLFISEKTVGHHLSSIFAKLELTDRLELLIYAYQHDLAKIPPPPRSGPTRAA
jgi:two-component system nitrate/nitrite response regulator NarL